MSSPPLLRPVPADAGEPSAPIPDGGGLGLIDALKRPSEIPRPYRVYVNRNLKLDQIKMVGFDMDYTLALYDQARIEELSVLATLHKLVTSKGYPEAVRKLPYDPRLAMRGLLVDLQEGNVFKPDRYGTPGRVMHGRRVLDRARAAELYQRERTRLSHERFAWIDSLFALPEAVLYVDLVEFFDHQYAGPRPSYLQLWRDVRECIDLAHRDGSIKAIVAAELPGYVERDPALAETLHRLRSTGKRLFLLTNSEWTYTDPVMRYLLDGALAAYPSWRNYFDVIIVSAGKPGFFTEARPFVELDPQGLPLPALHDGPFVRGRVYAGGNVRELEARAKAHGHEVLYVGDHIYGDMLRTRKASAWRTAMILQELEHEVATHDRVAPELARLDDLERRLRHLDAEIADTQMALRALQRSEPSAAEGLPAAEVAQAKRALKAELDRLRGELQARMLEHLRLETDLDAAFNPYWGPLFREGHEVSKFGEQVEAYACVYTSRVSNFRFYSPSHHFRGPRDRMPHER
jgi:HAD superfamily 5'-nucleotidase-like hydrolase